MGFPEGLGRSQPSLCRKPWGLPFNRLADLAPRSVIARQGANSERRRGTNRSDRNAQCNISRGCWSDTRFGRPDGTGSCVCVARRTSESEGGCSTIEALRNAPRMLRIAFQVSKVCGQLPCRSASDYECIPALWFLTCFLLTCQKRTFDVKIALPGGRPDLMKSGLRSPRQPSGAPGGPPGKAREACRRAKNRRFLAYFGPNLAIFGHFWPILGRFWPFLAYFGPKISQKRVKKPPPVRYMNGFFFCAQKWQKTVLKRPPPP